MGCAQSSGQTVRRIAAAVAVLLAPTAVRADGWHNAALATSSLDQWLQDVRTGIPDLAQRLGGSSLQSGRGSEAIKRAAESASAAPDQTARESARGGTIQANLTPQQRALLGRKANDCMDVLAFMDQGNIIPREFPNFQLGKMGEYRDAAKRLLGIMGAGGAEVVATRLRGELMGQSLPLPDRGVHVHANYYSDMVEVLQQLVKQGEVSEEIEDSLRQAATGRKDAPRAALAAKVEQALDAGANLTRLLERWAGSEDANRKHQIENRIHQRIGEAADDELLAAAQVPGAVPKIRQHLANEISQRLAKLDVLQLLQAMNEIADAEIQHAVDQDLAQRDPTYAQVKDRIPAIWKLAAAQNERVAQYARWHIANAFQRAPISHCLYWLAQGQQDLNQMIWQQVDARIQRADAERQAAYAETALAALRDKAAVTSSQLAAIELLVHLKRQQVVGEIVDLLPLAPRELWPSLGGLLRSLTGQEYGPRPGDGLAEVTVAIRQWREWWERNK